MARLATEEEVAAWRREGWVLLEGLVGTDEIDAATEDLWEIFPSAEEYHADPDGVTERWKGRPAEPRAGFVWPEEGPGFRPEQQRWVKTFPFPGAGRLNRLCVHASVVDFAERALGTPDIRLYQAQASAKYSGLTNYEQPMHTDRNHSWLPAVSRAPWWNVQGFLYLSDVTDDDNPTRLVRLSDSAGATGSSPVAARYGVLLPGMEPDLYRLEHRAPGVRGSYLAYRADVFHRGAPFESSGTARFLLALAFKGADQDWIGYDTQQSVSTSDEWTAFVEGSSVRDLELFGFPPPGHPIWSEELLDATAERYPGLDLGPWRAAQRT
ncbi:MAG: hypothetical protein M0Z95_08550 [Actinomycetota bacterium]|nr:hypothetical protein [Actinomycetota bacterium]